MSAGFRLGVRTDQGQKPSAEREYQAYTAAVKALHALSYVADEIEAETVKADKIEAKIDRLKDQYPLSVRGEAEAALALMRGSIRRNRDEAHNAMVTVEQAWPVMGDRWRAELIEGMPALPGVLAMWRFVPDAGIWRTLRLAAGEGNSGPCPF